MVTTTRNNLVESIEPMKAPASTAFLTGSWVKADGSGGVVPLTPTAKVLGLCGETVSSTDSNYATAKYISVDTVSKDVDRFLMPVISTITAGAFVTGTTYTILTVGTTDFTLIGAASNTVGVSFVATGAGSGTGTATTAGGATAAMEQLTFDVSGSDAYSLNITTAGTQFRITKYISSTQVEVSVLLTQ